MMVAPFDLGRRVRELIERERDHARASRPARIIVKLNSLVDENVIKALYEASSAGVKIDLIVRGICCLRPGIPGVSDNIRVISIVGRFLEHSRIYYFGNNGEPRVYLASADWMPRNFYRRVEIAFPIESPKLRDEIIKEILPAFLNDRVKARELLPDGSYMRLKPRPGEPHSQAQLFFRERARKFFESLTKASSKAAAKLTPIEMAPGNGDGGRP
jgi:polyphosphate kinase